MTIRSTPNRFQKGHEHRREANLDYTIKIGGEAGQGIQVIGDSLGRVFARSGYHLFIHQDYESRIRGGHNTLQIRVSDRPVTCSRDKVDISIALDETSVEEDHARLAPGGIIVYDPGALKGHPEGPEFFGVPSVELAKQEGGSAIMANSVATGAVLGMLRVNLDMFLDVISEAMQKKGGQVAEENRRAARRGYAFALEHCAQCAFEAPPAGRPLMLVDGNAGVGLGAVLAGCTFYAGYPMTPSTGILMFMADRSEELGIHVEQTEDEIAAVNMAIGASFAGARSMTATAGGGFALMVEGVSLAAMTETPLVVAVGQRPAPATGLPTRTEQGDLLFVLHAGHGEFPRVVLAPGSPEQALRLTAKAFDLAEKYQVTVFILTDQHLADSQWTYGGFDLSGLPSGRYRVTGGTAEEATAYKRYAFTPSGVSSLAVPGQSRCLVVADSDEHDEEGHLTEDAGIRNGMVQKRLLLKLPSIRREMAPPLLYGDNRPENVIVGWGSTYGVLKEAVDRLTGRFSIALLHFSEIYPFPETDRFDYPALLRSARRTICVEQNATSQFAGLLRAETGHAVGSTINRYDGRPYLLEEILEEIDGRLA